MGFRKCSQCEKTGHNSRTCNNLRRKDGGIVKLFGVELASLASSNHDFSFSSEINSHKFRNNGYPSDATSLKIRKKGVAWSEEEHKLFVLGIEKLGKGDWKGISSNYVKTRTPTQVASHAQKYFLRQKNNIANNNKYGPTLLSLVGRNADSSVVQVNRKESSIFSAANIIYKNSKSYGYTMPEIPFCRLFSNCASPSLELSLGTPPTPTPTPTPTCLEYSSSFWQRRYAEIIYDLNQ